MTRRTAICFLCVACAAAPITRSEVLEAVSPLAAALSRGDAEGFLFAIRKDAPNRDRLGTNVRALLADAEITCSVEVISTGTNSAELQWFMNLRTKATQTVSERRRETVRITVRGKQIASIEPVSFFAPPRPSAL